MLESAVILLTAVPVLLCALIGFRLGGNRIILAAGPWILAWASGIFLAGMGMKMSWFHPFGLITPLILGVFCGAISFTAICRLAGKFSKQRESLPPSPGQKLAGAVLGMGGGICIASILWLLVQLAGVAVPLARQAPTAAGNSKMNSEMKRRWIHSLARTANRGFLCHLPLVGPLSDEVEALIYILNTDPQIRERFAIEKDWVRLKNIPAYRAIARDRRIFEEMVLIREGDLTALYRLQSNPLVIDFFQDPEVQEMISGDLRPSVIAGQIEELMSDQRIAQGSPP